jgi:hypothetical protein
MIIFNRNLYACERRETPNVDSAVENSQNTAIYLHVALYFQTLKTYILKFQNNSKQNSGGRQC